MTEPERRLLIAEISKAWWAGWEKGVQGFAKSLADTMAETGNEDMANVVRMAADEMIALRKGSLP